MRTGLRQLFTAMVLLIPTCALAQASASVTLTDPDPPAWDAYGYLSWLTVNKTGVAPEWNRWYDVATVGGSVGRFVGRHLKLDVDVATSASAEVYVEQDVRIPGQPYPVYVSQPQRFRTTSLAGGAAYQFFDNRWFHPFAGGGIEAVRETRTVERALYPMPLPPGVIVDPEGENVTWRTLPYASVGFKWFVGERTFVRSDVRTTFDRGGVSHVSWRTGVGVDF